MLRHLARILLGAAYVQQGIEQLRHPQEPAEAARPYVKRIAGSTPLPDDPTLVVRAGGGALVIGGLGLATNTAPRLAAALLALVAVPFAILRHPIDGLSALRGPQGTRLLTDLGLVGGAVIAALDTEGRPGIAWRARHGSEHASRSARRRVRSVRRTARAEARAARYRARAARHEVRRAAHDVAHHTTRSARDAVRDTVRDTVTRVGDTTKVAAR
jgi:uncharacterized membrane protein YphA (DoxX/SURF4 family)